MNLNHTMEGLSTCQGNPTSVNTNKLVNGEWGRENKYSKKDSSDSGAAGSRKDINCKGNNCAETDSSETEVSSERTTYVKGKFLGKGGFAQVHELLDLSTGTIYAGKIIPKNRITKPHHIQKIAREISIHRNLIHKNVVRLHHFFEDKINAYIVLENCPRKSLFHVLKHRYSVTEPEARFYLRQLAEGVKYIHTQKVIHRDLKPGNMLLTEDMTVKLGDFGLATLADGNKKGSLCGTPNYMAPEVLKKLSYSYEADVWAVGCILYAMLVGQPPFETASLKETYTRIVNNKYTIPLQLTEPARKLIRQLLHPQPESRIVIDKIVSHEFYKNGYTPTSLSSLCCFTAPVFSSNSDERHFECEPMETSATPLPCTSVAAVVMTTAASTPTPLTVSTTSFSRTCRTAISNTTVSMTVNTYSISVSVHTPKVISTPSRSPASSAPICSSAPSTSTSTCAAFTSTASAMCSMPTTSTLTVSSIPIGVTNSCISTANNTCVLNNTNTTNTTTSSSNYNKTVATVVGNASSISAVSIAPTSSTTVTISAPSTPTAPVTTTVTTTAATTTATTVTAATTTAVSTSISATFATVSAAAVAAATTAIKTATSMISSPSSNSVSNTIKGAEYNFPAYKYNPQKNVILSKISLKQKLSNVLCPDKVERRKENNTSSMYDVVVSCLKTMPPTPEKIEDNSSEGVCCPVFVSKWIDYSNKYGFGFQLSDRSVGILFNDNTRISFSSDRSHIEFHDINGRITSHPHHAVPEPLHERLALLKHFSDYMQENLSDGGYVSNRGNHKQKFPILQMKRWVRTNTAIIMELTNGTLQINFFQDHTKIILSAGKLGYIVTYINSERQSSSYWIHQIAQTGSEKSIFNRLKFAAAVLREFAELDDGKV